VYGGVNGGGVHCESTTATVTNCIITGNTAYYLYGGSEGGGAYSGTLLNCIISNNLARNGGGVSQSSLANCQIIGNSTGGQAVSGNGGGAYMCRLTNCVVSKNWAGYYGGGAASSTLVGCIISDNFCADWGTGGAQGCTLINCTVVNNTGRVGGVSGTAKNSVIYYNSNTISYLLPNGSGNFTNCCITPLPALPMNSGWNNFTNPPLFVDLAGEDFRLQSNSPCINAGNNFYLTNFPVLGPRLDLDRNTRISGGAVDLGAYEYQSPASALSYAWAQQYGLPIDGSADFIDSDGDGMNNWQECFSYTDPTNSSSLLRMSSVATNNPTGVIVTWESVQGANYYLQRSSDLSAITAFATIQMNINGQSGTTSYTDANAVGNGPYFYRVGVQ